MQDTTWFYLSEIVDEKWKVDVNRSKSEVGGGLCVPLQ